MIRQNDMYYRIRYSNPGRIQNGVPEVERQPAYAEYGSNPAQKLDRSFQSEKNIKY